MDYLQLDFNGSRFTAYAAASAAVGWLWEQLSSATAIAIAARRQQKSVSVASHIQLAAGTLPFTT